jgi:histidine triad (HIT) family protein
VTDCLFCRIAQGQIPARKVHEDAELVAFHDVNPQAPVHVLVIPRRHVASIDDLGEADGALAARLVLAIPSLARTLGIGSSYRVVTNRGAGAGQSVFHLHLHLLGGRPLGWPPG